MRPWVCWRKECAIRVVSVVEIDLRPIDVKRRAAGMSRLVALTDAIERLARIVLPIICALTYLRCSTVAISDAKNTKHTELRRLSDSTVVTATQKRKEAISKSRARLARERSLALDRLFVALEGVATPEVSLVELSARGSAVTLKGEVADISTLQALLSELAPHMKGTETTVESIPDDTSGQKKRHGRFSVNALLAGYPAEVEGTG